jgi:elongation factor Ts
VITTALEEHIVDIDALRTRLEEKRAELVVKIGENVIIRRVSHLEGMLGSYLHSTRIGVIVSATGAEEDLVKHIAMHIAASKPEYISVNDVPINVMERERKIQLEIAMQSGKSREIAEKMVEGRMRKFISEISLTGQHFVMDPSKIVGDILRERKAAVNDFVRFEVGEGIEKVEVNFAEEVAAITR